MGGRGEDVVGDKVGGGLKDWRKGNFAGFGTLSKGTRRDAGGGEGLCPTLCPSV